MSSRFVEALETRRVLASVTLIAPTWDGGIGGWVQTDANDITARLGGPSAVPNYTLTIAPDSNGTLVVQGVTHVAGTATPQTSADSNIVVIIDYTSVSTNPYYPHSEVGQLVANYMITTPVDGVRWAELPIHEMDLSRSTGLMDQVSYYLGQAGVWVDQQTYMDPHPISSIGDANPTVYDNVAFADDYWRTSGQPEEGVEYNGEPVDGAYNQELPEVQAENDGYPDAHVAVAGYYTGTIDFNSTWDGDGPVYSDWYGNTPAQPAREDTGFYYSAVVGGTRPLDGVWAASGGTGTRTPTGQNGTQWPNVTDLSTTSDSVFSGQSIGLNYIHEDRGAAASVTFYLDSDQNPYNGLGTEIGQTAYSASDAIAPGQFSGSTAGVAPGTYYVVTETSDGSGEDRYAYGNEITVAAAPPVTLLSNAHAKSATVTGTSTTLLALATDSAGGGDLTYTWSTMHAPSGAAAPNFSANGTNASREAHVAFSKDGTYVFHCTIATPTGAKITSDVSVVVEQTAIGLRVTPHNEHVSPHKKLAFSATVLDQFGHVMRTQPSANYSVASGAGTIAAASGMFTASAQPGHALIEVKDDDLKALVSVSIDE